MPGSAGKWAARRTRASGSEEDPPSGTATASPSTGTASSGSGNKFEDDQHELPGDHRPLMLLQGWDQPPPPPPPPAPPSGSGSGSGSGSESGSEGDSDSGSSISGGSSGSGGEEGEQPPQPQLMPPFFACSTCAFFKALGNGTFGCENSYYQKWSGTDRIVETKSGRPVLNPDRACSDWYEPAQGAGHVKVPTRHNGGA